MTGLRLTRWVFTIVCLGLGLSGPARADEPAALVQVTYAELANRASGRVTFETVPQRPEPGLAFDQAMRLGALWLGEHFGGQTLVDRDGFDAVTGPPAAPLALRAGQPGANLSVAFHRGFGSNALFALGPKVFPDRGARGEGAVAVLFDSDQAAIGLRIHTDYPDPLGQRAAVRGHADVILYSRNGKVIARHRTRLSLGITDIALRRVGGQSDIAGILIVNDDPGGIAIDDILYQIEAMLG